MTHSLNKTLAHLRQSIEQGASNLSLSRASKQIAQLKKELDCSFSEFGDVSETIATYNFYRQLNSLQQQINQY